MITVPRRALLAVLRVMARIRGVPVWDVVTLDGTVPGRLLVTRQGLQTAMTRIIMADGAGPDAVLPVVTVGLKRLTRILAVMPGADLTIAAAEAVDLTGARYRVAEISTPDRGVVTRMATHAEDCAITVEPAPIGVHGTLPGEVLTALLGSVAYAMSTEENRFYLNGVCLEFEPGTDETTKVTAVATNGHRLATVSRITTLDVKTGIRPIIPSEAVAAISALSDEDVTLQFSFDGLVLDVCNSTTRIVAKLIDGTFPRWQAVIPPPRTTTVSFDRDDLLRALRPLLTFASKANGGGVHIVATSDALHIRTDSPDRDGVVVTVPAKDGGAGQDGAGRSGIGQGSPGQGSIGQGGVAQSCAGQDRIGRSGIGQGGVNGFYLQDILRAMPRGVITMDARPPETDPRMFVDGRTKGIGWDDPIRICAKGADSIAVMMPRRLSTTWNPLAPDVGTTETVPTPKPKRGTAKQTEALPA